MRPRTEPEYWVGGRQTPLKALLRPWHRATEHLCRRPLGSIAEADPPFAPLPARVRHYG
jgi:hypothetical protein